MTQPFPLILCFCRTAVYTATGIL